LWKNKPDRGIPLCPAFFIYFEGLGFMVTGKNYTVQPGDSLSLIVAKNPDLGYSGWQELYEANKSEIIRVGREQMAALGITGVTRGPPCGISGHTAPKHYIVDGVHFDEPNVPTIYPGTTFFLKNNSVPEETGGQPSREAVQTSGEVISKKWTGTEHQSPAPKLEIFINGDPNTPDIKFYPDATAGAWSKLLAYTFSEATDDLEGAFSFTVENEIVEKEEKSVFDIIPVRSIVKIYEGDTIPAFVGIIRRREIKKAMTSQGVKKSVVFSGKSIISCITEYTVSLDVRIQGISDHMSKNKELTAELAKEGLTIQDFMKTTWEHFKKVSEGKAKVLTNTWIADIINKFIGGGPDTFVEVTGKWRTFRYNVACVFYNASNNVIADVWRNILPERVYEFFSRCNKEGKPKIIARQVPYQPEDWENLDIYIISPISLTGYDLIQSDEEVYTAFVSYIIGSAMQKEFYMAVNQTGDDSIVQFDDEKRNIYGFKPLELIFNGYDRQGNSRDEKKPDLTESLKELNKMAYYWYSRLDEMYSGNITVITDFNEPRNNPRAGCRTGFLGGEFYINKADHSWNFGGTPTIKLTVSRGMIYDGGRMKAGKDGIIKNVGSRFRELEKENG
jgi:hypothetical protein